MKTRRPPRTLCLAAAAARAATAWLTLGLLGLTAPAGQPPQDRFDTLAVGGQVFSNVTVLSRTSTDVFLQHSGGLINVKVTELDPPLRARLGYEPVAAPAEDQPTKSLLPVKLPVVAARVLQEAQAAPAPEADSTPAMRLQSLASQLETSARQLGWRTGPLPPAPLGLVVAVAGVMLATYLFFCYCTKLIVEKTGQRAGPLVWVPLLQTFPLLRAAGLPAWWFLLWLLPLVNLVVAVIWCFKIVQARGKHPLWAVLLLLPGTNLVAFLYLAFSAPAGQHAAAVPPPLAQAA